jgi:hypothetical protein
MGAAETALLVSVIHVALRLLCGRRAKERPSIIGTGQTADRQSEIPDCRLPEPDRRQ